MFSSKYLFVFTWAKRVKSIVKYFIININTGLIYSTGITQPLI